MAKMNNDYLAKITLIALNFYPPMIRDDLLKSKMLGAYSRLLLETWVHFGSEDLSFPRNVIYDAFRRVYQGEEGCRVVDKSGREWNLSQSNASGIAAIEFGHAETNFLFSDCYGLHPDASVRTAALASAACTAGMTPPKYEAWLAIISSRPLDDDEMSKLLDELSQSPRNVERKIVEHIGSREIDYSTLIPNVEDYYIDLVGPAGECADIFAFAATVMSERSSGVINFEGADGLKRMLTCSSHSALVDAIDLDSIELSELEDVFSWLSENADVVSKVGAIELAIAYPKCSPKIAASAISMIEDIRCDDSSPRGSLMQFCDLVLLVGGELARNALFISSPPYWRRLAIFTHAAVLQRAIAATKLDIAHLSDSQCDNRAPLFLIQSAIDLRDEPRWQTRYLGPEQLKAEFLGRIFVAAERHSNTVHEQLRAHVLDNPDFKKEVRFPLAYLPGPLEGGIASSMAPPEELVAAIESALSSTPLELSSFIPLVNSALIFKLNDTQAELASRALKTANYQLRAGNNTVDLESVLAGLATVAAVTRTPSLGDEVIVLIRVLRNRADLSLNINQALTIGLIAAASRVEERDWIDFVGKLFSEISFQDLTQLEAKSIRFVLLELCRLKPELWRSVGGAHAALESILPYGQ
jgi:hypothetical protein